MTKTRQNILLVFSIFALCSYIFIDQIEENNLSKEISSENFSFRKISRSPDENKKKAENEAEIQYEKRMPDLIIIGMQKCGTTVLKYFLEAHPKLIATVGEVHFFEKDENFEKGKEWYLSKMPNAPPDFLIIEKTPDYMAVPICAKRIFEMKPTMKLVVVTCDPVRRTFSNYLHLKSVKRPLNEIAPGVQDKGGQLRGGRRTFYFGWWGVDIPKTFLELLFLAN